MLCSTTLNSDFEICRFVPTRRNDPRTQTGSRQRFAEHPLSLLPHKLFYLSSSAAASCPSLPCPSPLIPSLPALLAPLHSLLLHLRQVAQCAAPCPFLADIACHYVSLCRSLIPLPPPSLLFPSTTGEST